jgi:hypothetical protein
MSEVLHESESLKRSVICIKKQFLCATSVKIMHWEVNDMLIIIDYETALLHAGYLHYRSFTMRGTKVYVSSPEPRNGERICSSRVLRDPRRIFFLELYKTFED